MCFISDPHWKLSACPVFMGTCIAYVYSFYYSFMGVVVAQLALAHHPARQLNAHARQKGI